jgi:hypothetical protein
MRSDAQILEVHLAALSQRLPAATVDELADGLTETWQHHLAAGVPPERAVQTAVAEFGDPEQIVDAFVAQAPGRRIAARLLVSGPLVGVCWGASLIATRAWTWPVPTLARILFGFLLCTVVVALITATTSRHSYRRTRLGAPAALGLIGLDAAMLTTVAVIAPVLAWPLLAAIPASLTRIAMTLRSLPAALTH